MSSPVPKRGQFRLQLVIAIVLATSATSGTSVLASDLAMDGFTSRIFAKGLNQPQALVPLTDSSVLIAERPGHILFLEGDTRTDLGAITVEGAKLFYVSGSPFTEGLKDLVKIPGEQSNYLWCMTTGDENAFRWTVGRADIKTQGGSPPTMTNEIVWQSDPQTWTRSNPPPFSGCRLAFDGPDVIVALGANSRASGSGRIIRFARSAPSAPHLISSGHRNPSGLVLSDGVLWETEHGPKGGDELNVITEGGDYGWPTVSRGTPDDGNHRSFATGRPGLVDPVLAWTPAIAPSSLTQWRGKLYVGTLKGPGVIELTVKGRNVVSQVRFFESSQRIRDVRAAPDGSSLWVMTDGPNAELIQVRSKEAAR